MLNQNQTSFSATPKSGWSSIEPWNAIVASISQQIHQVVNLDQLLETTIEEIAQILKSDRVVIYQLDREEQYWSGQVRFEVVQDEHWQLRDRVIQHEKFEPAWLEGYESNQTWVMPNIQTAVLTPCHAEFLGKLDVQANLVVPIFCEAQTPKLWGLLIAHQCTAPRVWQDEEIHGLQQVGLHLGIALYQAELITQLHYKNLLLNQKVQERVYQTSQLAAIIESSQDAIISKTLDGTITSWNDSAERLFGYSTAEMLGQSILIIIPEKLRSEEACILQELEQGKQIDPYVTQRQCKDGTLIDVALTLSPIRNEQGEIIGASKILRDIRHQKQTEAKLRNLSNRLSLALKSEEIGTWEWNLQDNDEVYWDERMYALYGWDKQNFKATYQDWAKTVFPEDFPKTETALQIAVNTCSEYNAEFRIYRSDGKVCWIKASALVITDDQGQAQKMIGVNYDITDRKQAELDLQASELLLSSILNSSLDGIMAFRSVRDDSGKIIDFTWLLSNPTACKIVGRTREKLVGQRLLKLLPGHQTDGLFDDYIRVVETGKPLQKEFYYDHDGIEAWFENVTVKLADGFAVTFRNVTAIKQSEENVQQINQKLAEHITNLSQRHQEMLVLSDINDYLQACLTVDEACEVFNRLVEPLFPNCAGALFITCASRNRVELRAMWGSALPSTGEFNPKDCWGLRRGSIHTLSYNSIGQRYQGLCCNHIPTLDNLKTALCIPMSAQNETLGLFFLSTTEAIELPEAKQQLAQAVAKQLGMALANLNLRETLHHQSIRDALTGLFNRRYLEESLQQEVIRAQRQQYPISIVMIDVDHFKKFNDTYGHDAGDYVLQVVSNLLQDSVRGSDIACRYGGEELTLILPELPLEHAQIKAEAIRKGVEEFNLTYNNQRIGNVTISLGLACFPRHGLTGAAVLQAADSALYQAKAAGRNRLIVAI